MQIIKVQIKFNVSKLVYLVVRVRAIEKNVKKGRRKEYFAQDLLEDSPVLVYLAGLRHINQERVGY